MFLHIGEGKIIDKDDIIGVFDLDNTSTSKKTREFLRNSEKKGIVTNVSEEIPKTYIICEKNGEERVYITQISPKTLLKRAERNEEFGTEN